MHSYSEAYAGAVHRGYTLAHEVFVLSNGLAVTSMRSDPSVDFDITGGSVTADRTSARRRTFEMHLAAPSPELVPNFGDEMLSTTGGYEFEVWSGLVLPDGSEELFRQGIFTLTDVDVEDSGSSCTMTLRGEDRSRQVARNRFTEPYVVAAGNGVERVRALVADRRPATQFWVVETSVEVPRLVLDAQADPWTEAQKLAESFGYEVFFDVRGHCVIQPEPNSAFDDAVWGYAEGDTCMATKFRRASSNERAFNGKIVEGASTYGITPAVGVAWDTNPHSPTYYLGAYGKVPDFEVNERVATQAQANAAAAAGLQKVLGATEVIDIEMVPNPAQEEGDVVYLKRDRLRMDLAVVLNRLTIPLGLGTMTATSKERRQS